MDNKETLERFIDAQKNRYERILGELKAGKKRTHWIWFIFPQLRCLGKTTRALRYGIADINEAREYLAHPVLGKRLVECCETLLLHTDKTAFEIFQSEIDDVKFRSSMTLFAFISQENSVFHRVLNEFYGGNPDLRTNAILRIQNFNFEL